VHDKEPCIIQLSTKRFLVRPEYGRPDNSAPILCFICASVQRLANIGGFHWIACVGCLQVSTIDLQRFAYTDGYQQFAYLVVAPICLYIHGLQRFANIRSLQQFTNIHSFQWFDNIRNFQRFANIRSLQRFANIHSLQRFNIRNLQRFANIRGLQRFANIRSLQRFSNIRSLRWFANISKCSAYLGAVSMALSPILAAGRSHSGAAVQS
jgi:hypothetical protein